MSSAVVDVSRKRDESSPRRRGSPSIGSIALFGLALAWYLLLGPRFLGGPTTYVVVGGSSMEPTLRGGDLVLARRQDSYAVGDIVAYRIPEGEVGEGILVIHRIKGGSSSEGFVMQGDHRDGPDIWRPRPGDIQGKLVLRIPSGGGVLVLLRSPLVLAAIAGVISFFVAWRMMWRDDGREPEP